MPDIKDTAERVARHTPGPWTVGDPTSVVHDYPKRYTSESVSIHALDHACVATVYGGCEGGSVGRPYVCLDAGRANARLITASPRLLSALESLERAIDGFSRGEDFYVRDHGLALMLARKEARAAIAEAKGAA